MNKNPDLSLQTLSKIGAPIAAAIETAPPTGDDAEIATAQLMAKMLAHVVSMSLHLSTQIGLPEDNEIMADSIRGGCAAIAAQLLANYYINHRKEPDEQEIQRLIKTQESILVFSDNYKRSADETAGRLTTLDPIAPLYDATQASLVMMQSLTPVMQAIDSFAYGQEPHKLLSDITQKLQSYASEILSKSQIESKEGDLNHLLTFKTLAELYANCHQQQTQKISSSDSENTAPNIDHVWNSFETYLVMINTILNGAPDSAPTVAPVTTPVEPAPAAPQPTAPTAAPDNNAANPMAMFGTPKTDNEPPAESSAPAPAPTPATDNNAANPMAMFSVPKTDNEPPVETPTEAPASNATPAPATPPSDNAGNGGGGPMSFFTNPNANKDDNNES